MPRARRLSRRQSDVYTDAIEDTGEQVPAATIQDIMLSLQRSQNEALERLLERVIPTQPPPLKTGDFAACSARFSGRHDESVEVFLDAVTSYKDCKNISAENAIRGMSMLLTDSAATWWLSIKQEVHSWEELTDRLRHAYGDRRPAYRIYRDLFRNEQGNKKTDIFVAECRALLSKLPSGDLTIKAQLDMIFASSTTASENACEERK